MRLRRRERKRIRIVVRLSNGEVHHLATEGRKLRERALGALLPQLRHHSVLNRPQNAKVVWICRASVDGQPRPILRMPTAVTPYIVPSAFWQAVSQRGHESEGNLIIRSVVTRPGTGHSRTWSGSDCPPPCVVAAQRAAALSSGTGSTRCGLSSEDLRRRGGTATAGRRAATAPARVAAGYVRRHIYRCLAALGHRRVRAREKCWADVDSEAALVPDRHDIPNVLIRRGAAAKHRELHGSAVSSRTCDVCISSPRDERSTLRRMPRCVALF